MQRIALFFVFSTACSTCPNPAPATAEVVVAKPAPEPPQSAMPSATAEAPKPPLRADLPTTRDLDGATFLSVEITAAGSMSVDGAPVADDASFLERAKKAHARAPDVRAIVKADASTRHGVVIHALDLLKQAGIAKIAFGVAPASP